MTDEKSSNDHGRISKTDQNSTSPFGIPQAESTHQYNDITNVTLDNTSSSTTINQTIDFGENDSSTLNATLKSNHENEDELFYILEGSLLFEVEGKENFILNQGDFYIVKQGIKHRVSSKEECKIMLIEPKTTAHTGSVKSEITKSISDQQ